MERVFPVTGSFPFRITKSGSDLGFPVKLQIARIESILGPGHYIVSLPTGGRVEVRGPISLKEGNRVQLLVPIDVSGMRKASIQSGEISASRDEGYFWNAFIPLAFGGESANAKLEVFVEKKLGKPFEKIKPAIYFIFTVETATQGSVQWSVYLRENWVALQVYAAAKATLGDRLKSLIQTIEKSLKSKGFLILTPTLILEKPFKVPPGFKLNVSG